MSTTKNTWVRPVLSFGGLLVAYYLVPVSFDDTASVLVPSLLGTIAGLGVVAWTVINELDHLLHGEESRSTAALAMLLLLLVVAFSLTFYLLERSHPGQVADLHTRTDALYFTLSTMATVGYGDVHAEGQAARALVCAVIVFDVVVVASLVRAHTARRASER
jgi:voltage-gated potassium channel